MRVDADDEFASGQHIGLDDLEPACDRHACSPRSTWPSPGLHLAFHPSGVRRIIAIPTGRALLPQSRTAGNAWKSLSLTYFRPIGRA